MTGVPMVLHNTTTGLKSNDKHTLHAERLRSSVCTTQNRASVCIVFWPILYFFDLRNASIA